MLSPSACIWEGTVGPWGEGEGVGQLPRIHRTGLVYLGEQQYAVF